ncbi:DNA-binding GntR family transcriptional regulator [Bacillus horti]|uniref:DNA-binding GntR family transcriptional regulator n=1 Tax=Caldalkalibacillus horti TaxID=77523 RepID=A0ABT9VZZ7_9BACI|nr:GntR family transcriptional regulator [Bacillus horti]MDQ0166185.1 DNA-binding GntR family transcriptional regulator [Bacillus horti]
MLNTELKKNFPSYSTRDQVYEILKENILSLKLAPGRVISEKEMSELLEVSRTPVREAFVRLAQEELLEIYPQRGTAISLIDLHYVEEARFLREHLERAIVKLACKRFSEDHLLRLEGNIAMLELCVKEKNYTKLFELDEEFHFTLASGCDKERMWNVIQQMSGDLKRIRMLSLVAEYNWDLILSQHKEIVAAIKEGNEAKADQVMEHHLKKLTFEQESLKNEYPHFFK